MITGYIAQQIRRTNRNLLIVNIAIVVGILAIMVVAHSYLYECITGPKLIDVNDVAKLENADQAPAQFVRLHIDPDKLDRITYFITGGDDNRNDHYFFLHLDNGRVLIIKTHSDHISTDLQGSITAWDSDVGSKVISGVQPDVHGPYSSIMFDVSNYRVGMYFMGGIGMPLLALAIWNISKGMTRKGDPSRHPIAVQLEKFGPPEEIAVAIDAEYNTSAERTGNVILTQSWLMRPFFIGLKMVYLGDVVWAYKKETKTKAYGVVTTSRSYSTIVYTADGKSQEFGLSEKQVQALLADLARRVPWAIIGYSAQLLSAWNKQRPQFLAAVEERKQKVVSAPATPDANTEGTTGNA